MAATKHLPDDIVFIILSKLPIKSFKRFECVRKSWSLLIENTDFMNMFRDNFLSNLHCCSYYDQASLFMLVHGRHDEFFYSFSGEKLESKVRLDISNPFVNQEEEVFVGDISIFGFGSINGTFCLSGYGSHKIVLWNPSRDEFNRIPPSPAESILPEAARGICDVTPYIHGFGYDHSTCDYKVIRCVFFVGRHEEEWDYVPEGDVFGDTCLDPVWEIYSLKSNSWRKLDLDIPQSVMGTEDARLYMDGVCHWLCQYHSPLAPCLVSFDVSSEEFFVTSIPDDCFVVGASYVYLAMLNGYIASFRETRGIFHISILGELGRKESWITLFVVGPLSVLSSIGVGTKGEIFFRTKDRRVALYDLRTQMIEKLDYEEEACSFPSRVIVYKEG
ncbi:F-box/kelch-repeat protein At3g06240-like [Vicia villosa]|uniref:F-box/kelch-repeat protein At3g06240-like n=1 Tax=Vicia villosa TaxID=3911 RepID=UPI00273B84CE|nr:F-box/kelch-repeat protein At3g06240-like [Vicia villosa]